MLVMLLKGHLVCYFNLVLNQGCFAQVQSLWANRCSHLSSSSLACCSSTSGHSAKPWRFNSFRIHPFWGLCMESPGASIRRTTNGTWLARGTCQQLLWQGLLWDGHSGSSGKLALRRNLDVTCHMWQSVPWRQATGGLMLVSKHVDPHIVSLDACTAMYANSPKWGNSDPLCGMDISLNIIQAKFAGCCRVRAWGGSAFLPHFPVSP